MGRVDYRPIIGTLRDGDIATTPEAPLALSPVGDSVLRLVLGVAPARLSCRYGVAPSASMIDRDPEPMLA